MNITTKSGDGGVSYWNGRGVAKDDILIEAIGDLDEVQAVIELVDINFDDVKEDLWGVMGEIAAKKHYEKLESRLSKIEKTIDELDDALPKIDSFLIFTTERSRKLNWLRTVVRRAERKLVALSKRESVNPKVLAYVNRLSDYFYMMARKEENGKSI